MSLSSNFSCNFQEVRSFFTQCETIDVVVNGTNLIFLANRKGAYLIWGFDSVIQSTEDSEDLKDVMIGVTITSDILFKLPSSKKGLDDMTIIFYDDHIEIGVNKYKISLENMVFDRRNVDRVLSNLEQPHHINLNELRWLYLISKAYKDSTIEINGMYAFCNTADGVYATILKTAMPVAFGFSASILSKVFTKKVASVTAGDLLSIQFETGAQILATTYKPTASLVADLKYALKLVSKIRLRIGLYEHKDLLKTLRGNRVKFNAEEQVVILSSPLNEELKIYLGDDMQVDIASSSNFNNVVKLSEQVDMFTLDNTTLLKAISQERRGVEVFINPLVNIVKFGSNNNIALVPRKV